MSPAIKINIGDFGKNLTHITIAIGAVVLGFFVFIIVGGYFIKPIVDPVFYTTSTIMCDIKILNINSTNYNIEIIRCVGQDEAHKAVRYFDDILSPKSRLTIRDDYNSLTNVTVGITYRLLGNTTIGLGGFIPLPSSTITVGGDLLETFKKSRGLS